MKFIYFLKSWMNKQVTFFKLAHIFITAIYLLLNIFIKIVFYKHIL